MHKVTIATIPSEPSYYDAVCQLVSICLCHNSSGSLENIYCPPKSARTPASRTEAMAAHRKSLGYAKNRRTCKVL